MDINAIVDAVIAVLAPLSPHRIPYLPSNVSQLPLIAVTLDFITRPNPVEYGATIGDATHYVYLDVFLITGKNDEESAYRRLSTWLGFPGAASVKALIESNQTLGGLSSSVLIGLPAMGGTQGIGAGIFLGIHFPVQVEALT